MTASGGRGWVPAFLEDLQNFIMPTSCFSHKSLSNKRQISLILTIDKFVTADYYEVYVYIVTAQFVNNSTQEEFVKPLT